MCHFSQIFRYIIQFEYSFWHELLILHLFKFNLNFLLIHNKLLVWLLMNCYFLFKNVFECLWRSTKLFCIFLLIYFELSIFWRRSDWTETPLTTDLRNPKTIILSSCLLLFLLVLLFTFYLVNLKKWVGILKTTISLWRKLHLMPDLSWNYGKIWLSTSDLP